jgi:hypothetical protein
MKRSILYAFLLALLAVFAGCVKENPVDPFRGDIPEYPTEGKALVRMSAVFPVAPGTKAMADLPSVSIIRVAVFGSSGFLKEVVDAENVQSAVTNGSSTLYTFDVKLSLTDSKNLRVNVIANCDANLPWKYEGIVMCGSAYTTGNQDAYWARFTLPNGIALKMEYDDSPDVQSMVYVKEGNYYMVTDEVTDAFCGGAGRPGLPMLRNFAKMSVESTTPQLTLDPNTTMAIVNMPDRGSVAPYDATRSLFMSSYKDSTYAQLKAHYPGYSPDSMQYINSDPATVTFHPCGKDGQGNVTGGIYMFERPKPSASSDSPTYIIIHGKYRDFQSGKTMNDWKNATGANKYPGNPDNWLVPAAQAVDGYYKIDLMDDDGYYAILRNFRYHLRITGVSKAGASTPAEAGSTGGSGDISASQETQGLTDISNGYGRIAVSYVERTFVDQQVEVELKYKFIPDVEEGDNVIDNSLESEGGSVVITVNNATNGSPINVISSTLDSSISSQTGVTLGSSSTGIIKVMGSGNANNDAEGYRTIKFTTNVPSNIDRAEQVIQIKGMIDAFRSISRDVKFYLMEHQNMTVTCVADNPDPNFPVNAVEDLAGEGVNVNISIPTQLPESMFPLVFEIESDKLSITPNTTRYPDDNLPVESGFSICTGKTGKKTFHYNYTLSYDNYVAKAENQSGGKTFTCHFKTNMDDSASTIYVSNEYFNLGSAPFENYSIYNFSRVRFSNYAAAANTALNCSFYLDEEDTATSRTITVQLEGLRPQNTNSPWSVVDQGSGLYTYTYSRSGGVAGQRVTLPLTTLAAGQHNGSYSITLSANGSNGEPLYREVEASSSDFVWRTGSYTINLRANNGSNPSFTTAPQNVVFSNTEQGGNNNNNRYQYMGYRESTGGWWSQSYDYYSGSFTVTAPSNFNEAVITSITMVYNGNNTSNQAVTVVGDVSGSSTLSTKTSWTSSSVGDNTVTVTMACTNSTQYNARNQLTSVTVNYGYFEEP